MKELEGFPKQKRNNRHKSECKACRRESSSAYRLTEQGKEVARQYIQSEKGEGNSLAFQLGLL
jgi:hypothetical protein